MLCGSGHWRGPIGGVGLAGRAFVVFLIYAKPGVDRNKFVMGP